MFDFTNIPNLRLAYGKHTHPEEGLCFMEAVAFFNGEAHSDHPKCASPVLIAYGIGINDAMDDEDRNLLLPLVPLVAGTIDPANEQKRAEFLAMWAVNKIVPVALRAAGLEADAVACEQADTLKTAAKDAKDAAKAAKDAAKAADAAAAAWAAARAADAAYAASAASAASAAADTAVRAAEVAAIWPLAVEGLRQAILIGRHDGFDAMIDLEVQSEKLREMVGADNDAD